MPVIKLTNPKKSQVVLFDFAGSEVIQRMVLEGIDHEILHSRFEVFYLTPRVLWGVLKNIRYLGRMRQGRISLNLIKLLKQLFGSLYRVYLLTCIQCMRPKVVITYVDNSYSFQLISRIYKNAQFIAVQNGFRNRDCLKDSRPPSPQPGSIISMPMLICFGKYDIDSFKKYQHQIDSYYPLGSLKARYYKDFLSKERLERKFDLCLISEWDEDILLGKHMPNIEKGMIAIDDFLRRYIKEEKVSLCVALRSNRKKEEEYYLNKYGDQVFLVKSNRELMSSYDAVDQSSVAVAFCSTLAREAFGWGAKVLACNFSGDDQYDFPCSGFWSINEQDYDLFKKKLNDIRAMDIQEYRSQIKDCAAYIMNNDSKPPYEFVRELIFSIR